MFVYSSIYDKTHFVPTIIFDNRWTPFSQKYYVFQKQCINNSGDDRSNNRNFNTQGDVDTKRVFNINANAKNSKEYKWQTCLCMRKVPPYNSLRFCAYTHRTLFIVSDYIRIHHCCSRKYHFQWLLIENIHHPVTCNYQRYNSWVFKGYVSK